MTTCAAGAVEGGCLSYQILLVQLFVAILLVIGKTQECQKQIKNRRSSGKRAKPSHDRSGLADGWMIGPEVDRGGSNVKERDSACSLPSSAPSASSYNPFHLIMPFQTAEAARCPKCSHQVFAAEEMLAAGAKWHKICFTCGLCKKRLDSTNATEHNGDLWCRICYSRKFGPKGVGFGCGAGTLNMDKGEIFGNQESAANKPMDPYYGMNSKFINLFIMKGASMGGTSSKPQ